MSDNVPKLYDTKAEAEAAILAEGYARNDRRSCWEKEGKAAVVVKVTSQGKFYISR